MIRKILALSAIIAGCYACSNNAPASEAEKKEAAPAAKATDLSSNPDYQKGLALIAKNDCLTCHKIDEKLIGPPYRDVANKYTNDDATVEMLADKVIKGGTGVWGPVPMTPHAALSKDDAKQIVKYVLLLRNK
jgi:cytochrome c